jgi:hypothetical protein
LYINGANSGVSLPRGLKAALDIVVLLLLVLQENGTLF